MSILSNWCLYGWSSCYLPCVISRVTLLDGWRLIDSFFSFFFLVQDVIPRIESHPAVSGLSGPGILLSHVDLRGFWIPVPEPGLLSRVTRYPGQILWVLAVQDSGVRLCYYS